MQTTRALSFPALLTALALVGGASGGCDGGGEAAAPSLATEVGAGPCRLLECTSRLELVVRLPEGSSARARACVDERCLDVALGPGACGPGGPCEASAGGSYTIYLPLPGPALDDASEHVAALSLSGRDGGAASFADAVAFTLTQVEPGGPGCGACFQSRLEFAPAAAGGE